MGKDSYVLIILKYLICILVIYKVGTAFSGYYPLIDFTPLINSMFELAVYC